MEKLTLYSNDCPRCKVVKRFLDDSKIEYDIVTDQEEILKVAKRSGLCAMPLVSINGKVIDVNSFFRVMSNNTYSSDGGETIVGEEGVNCHG